MTSGRTDFRHKPTGGTYLLFYNLSQLGEDQFSEFAEDSNRNNDKNNNNNDHEGNNNEIERTSTP